MRGERRVAQLNNMQLACLYVPLHILAFHILPGLGMVPVGALLAVLL